MKVALYLRYSSAAQNEQSIEGQRTVCEEFCKRNKYDIVCEYVDRAKSAFKDTEKRTIFLQMINEAQFRKWDAVVVYKLDRFSRNKYDSAIYKTKLKKYGVSVISATENIADSPEGVLVEALLEGMAEYYSKELSQKVKRGMTESAKKCQTVGSTPLGYKVENKRYVPDPAYAPAIKLAFDMYADGESPHTIATTLNQLGYRTKRGTEFRDNSFSAIFTNKMYIGIYDRHGVYEEGAIEPIVDKEVFDKVQRTRVEAHKAPRLKRGKITYLLSGKLICGHCGANYRGDCGTSKSGKVHAYYSCKARKDDHTCTAPSVPKDLIEDAVMKVVLSVMTPQVMDELAERTYQLNQEDLAKHSKVRLLESQIENLDNEQNYMIDCIAKGTVIPTKAYGARLQEIEKEIDELTEELEQAKAFVFTITKEQILFFLKKFLNGSAEDERYKQHLINIVVKQIILKTEILPPDNKLKIHMDIEISLDGVGIQQVEIIEGCSDFCELGGLLKKYSNTFDLNNIKLCGTLLNISITLK